MIARRVPDAVTMILPADQTIRDTAGFQEVMGGALAKADHCEGLATIGIQAT